MAIAIADAAAVMGVVVAAEIAPVAVQAAAKRGVILGVGDVGAFAKELVKAAVVIVLVAVKTVVVVVLAVVLVVLVVAMIIVPLLATQAAP